MDDSDAESQRTTAPSRFPDPFAPKPHDAWKNATNALLATALFRCCFERYNEGRKLWSQILLGSRTFARVVWFQVPEVYPGGPADKEECRARVLVEKKTVINLLEAFAVAVKHYLRGEDGIYYDDLYHLVKFLPSYALPNSLPPGDGTSDAKSRRSSESHPAKAAPSPLGSPTVKRFEPSAAGITKRVPPALPLPATTPYEKPPHFSPTKRGTIPLSPKAAGLPRRSGEEHNIGINEDDDFLLPARMPPRYHLFDFFPFSLFIHCMSRDSKKIKGKKAARKRAKMANASENLPLEISLYLGSYIAALQDRKVLDAPTSNSIQAALNQLVDALTGLERILTTPIPFSYSVHLWVVTTIYCLALPLQIWATLKWITIPATVILAFIFFGFLVAGEEIENPFGYDKNDLNMDHFTHNIIRNELRAVTAMPAPNISIWAFTPENDLIFASQRENNAHVRPEDWIKQGPSKMLEALAS
ncbi:hypothetical protein HWV62_39850 [Athelia sp. TMB]|nr:hypothetical protein HWV62_39850 [Athelia sp. TMB]